MGTIVRRKKRDGSVSFRAVVRKAGIIKTDTFSKLGLARKWITDTEYAIEHRAAAGQAFTLDGLIKRYRVEIVEKLPYKRRSTKCHLRMLERRTREVYLHTMTTEWWVDFARDFENVLPSTRKDYISYVSRALSTAEELWDVKVDWVAFRKAKRLMKRFGLIGKGRQRERRVSDEELSIVLDKISSAIPVTDLVHFSIDSGMRVAEVCRLRWSDYDKARKMILVRDRKHPKEKVGNDWLIPLLGRTADIIDRQRRLEGADLIFPYNEESVSAAFRRARKKTPVENLHWHDLRHEAISRLFEAGYQIQEVALVSGHLDWASLKIYTQIKPHHLHDGPVSRRVIPPELLAQLPKAA